MTNSRDTFLQRLRSAYQTNDITLYLGAGVSVGNGLPTWEQLVLAMYFSAFSEETMAFANYLFAIAEWHLDRAHESLEITARKIRRYYRTQNEFMDQLRQTLYAGFIDTHFEDKVGTHMRTGNRTLEAVARLCENSHPGRDGVRSVITYNYDDLLEEALSDYPHQPIWKSTSLRGNRLPIYHVHGYVPMEGKGSTANELVFTEEQYHQMTQDPYSWANLVQLHAMSGTIGLMVGLSLSDRNMRRLLDAVVKTPLRTENYVVLQKPQWEEPNDTDLAEINAKAEEYLKKFERSGASGAGDLFVGMKQAPTWEDQVRRIIRQVEHFDIDRQTSILEALGVHAIWYDEHAEVADILSEVLQV